MPLSHLPPSYKAHLSLMLCGAALAVGITSLLVAGWRWHFTEIERRESLVRLSTLADKRYAELVAQRTPMLHDTTAAPSTVAQSPATQANAAPPMPAQVSLSDVATEPEGALFPDPVPLVADVSPERMSEAVETLQRYSNAVTWQDKLPYVAESERVKPLMHSFYETQKNADPESGNPAQSAHFKLNNTEVLMFSYPSQRSGGTLDLAMVAPLHSGRFLLDWESFVGAGEMSWQDFKKQRTSTPTLFRLYGRRDDYYNYEFSDPAQFLSLHLMSPDGLYFIFGYCERTSVVGKTLQGLLDTTSGRLPLTLRLAFPPAAKSDHCVKIVGVVANRWLLVK